jgi:hypothetical protein
MRSAVQLSIFSVVIFLSYTEIAVANVLNGVNNKTKIILAQNYVNGANTLTQKMIDKANTSYVFQYDFVLDADITLPKNCFFEFDGGKIDFNGHRIYGTVTNNIINIDNFALRGKSDVTGELNNIFSIAKKGCTVCFPGGVYNITGIVEVPRKCHVIGADSNTVIKINKPFSCIGILIKGDGSIIERLCIRSDLDYLYNHDYRWGSKEFGPNADTGVMIIANNCIVRKIKVRNLRQGIWLGNDYITKRYKNNIVENCNIDSCAICICAASQIKPTIANCEGSYITFDEKSWPPHFVYFTTGRTDSFIRDSYQICISNISAKQLDDFYMTAIQLKGCHKGKVENINAFDGCLFSISHGTSDLKISNCFLHNGNGTKFRMVYVSKAGGESCKSILFKNINLQGKGDFVGFQDTKDVKMYGLKAQITEILKQNGIFDADNENLVVSDASFYVEGGNSVGDKNSLIDCMSGSKNSLYRDIAVTPNYKGRININGTNSTFTNSFSRFNGVIYCSSESAKILSDDVDIERREIITEKAENYDLIITNSFKKKEVVISPEATISHMSLRLMEPFRDKDLYKLPIGSSFYMTFSNSSNKEIELSIDEVNGMICRSIPYCGTELPLKIPIRGELNVVLNKYSDGWAIDCL